MLRGTLPKPGIGTGDATRGVNTGAGCPPVPVPLWGMRVGPWHWRPGAAAFPVSSLGPEQAVTEQSGEGVDCLILAEGPADRFAAASDPDRAEPVEKGIER